MVTSHAVQPRRSRAGSVGAALPGIEIRLVDEARPRARGRGRRRDLDPRRQPVQRLLARRRRRPGRRGLVGHRRRRLPRRRRRPVPGRPAQGAGHRLRLQRLPERGRGRHPRGRRGRRGRRDRRRRRATGEAVVAYVVAAARRDADARSRTRSASTARSGWPASSSRPRIEVVDELPLTVTGKVAEGPAARHRAPARPRAARVTPRMTRPRHPLLPARLPPVRRRPRGGRAGLRRARRVVRRGLDRPTTRRSQRARTARRSR